MAFLRHGQPVITNLNPHNANRRFLKTRRRSGEGGGPAPGPTAAFEALVPDDNGVMQGVKTGTGDLTATHTSAIYAPDHAGVYRPFANNTPVWSGGKFAGNLARTTHDLTQWVAESGTITGGISDPDGGTGAVRFTATGGLAQIYINNVGEGSVTFSVWIRANGALNDQVRVMCGTGYSVSYDIRPQLSEEWQRLTFQPPSHVPAEDGRLGFRVNGFGTNDEIDVYQPMAEPPVATATPYVENQNTAPLYLTKKEGAESPYLVYQPLATNALTHSRDFTNAAWSGAATATMDSTGIDGTPNSAATVTKNGTGDAYIRQSELNFGTNTFVQVWYVGKDSDESRFPAIFGGAGQMVHLNTATGAVVLEGGGVPTNLEVISVGNFWKVLQQHTGTGAAFGHRLAPARASVFGGAFDSNVLGSAVFGQAELHDNKTLAEVRGLGPIFTAADAASTDATVYRFDAANYNETQSAKYFEQIAPETGTCYEAAFSTFDYVTSWNAAERFFYFNGSNRSSVESTDRVPNTPAKCGVSFHADTSEAGISVDGGAWVEGQNFVSVNLGSPGVGVNGNRPCQIRNLRRYDIESFDEGKAIIDGLMA